MAIRTVTDAIRYVGVDDNTLALFENQYSVQPMGVSYNSYVILDEKIAVMDSVDARAAEEWLSNVARVLEGRSPDYLVVTHMEPDHSGSLMRCTATIICIYLIYLLCGIFNQKICSLRAKHI